MKDQWIKHFMLSRLCHTFGQAPISGWDKGLVCEWFTARV